ncbi:tRNA pseudouridine synthase Pus10 [Chelonus insularis]|uniref:tRNA pseudouridine synthase Pus10 n=1 Tax=Chelonus insularis TaxID=460826 RepID=UPI00158AA702|nr:tRNA pseudouridine synthase Pus10 [Chelonus insularis]
MDSDIKNDTKCEMFIYLKDIGCCLKCCLRLSGIKTIELLNEYIKDYKVKCVPDNIGVFDEKNSCIACLGIMYDEIQDSVVDQIAKEVISNGYDASIFSGNLTVPMSLMLREKSIDEALTQKFSLTESQWNSFKYKTHYIKDAWKTDILPRVEKKISKKSTPLSNVPYLMIMISFSYSHDDDDCKKLLKGKISDFSRNKIEQILSDNELKECLLIPPPKPSTSVLIDKIYCSHGSIFIGGRYSKLSRQLSQTPWFINGEKKMETSVQDLLSDIIVNYTKADAIKFLSSGREDVDVRTINLGRPFAIELINPKITKALSGKLKEMVDEINASTKLIRITSEMKILSPLDLKKLKEGENEKTKFYRALCIVKDESCNSLDLDSLQNIKNLEIVQKTPLRVLHRRPFTPRIRVIHAMRGRWLTSDEKLKVKKRYTNTNVDQCLLDKLFIIDVKTQAGTYVKEFVHGDFNRTKPSLCDVLGVEVDIVALDVTGINIHWP